jgi:hypothetical protein
MLNKVMIVFLLIFTIVSIGLAQPDSTSSWHLQWQYETAMTDTGIVDNFIISRLNSEDSQEKKVTLQKNEWQVIGTANGNSIFQQQDTGLKPGVIYAYTVYAASSDTLTSAASNVAEGAVPLIYASDSIHVHVDQSGGTSSGIIPLTIINPLEETLLRTFKKEIHSASGGSISNENFSTSSFTFNSTMDDKEYAYIDLTVTNADTSKAFFYTRRVVVYFTYEEVTPPDSSSLVVGVPNATAWPDSVRITWQTSQASRDYIRYGMSHDKSQQSDQEASAAIQHARTLNGLTPETLYYYQIISYTATSGPHYSPEYQFLTAEEPPAPGTARKTRIFPGKFIAAQHTVINFYDIPAGGSVTIYNWVGDIVYEKEGLPAGDFAWDVKNPSGKNISSGFYLYFIQDGQGKVEAQGKFIVIR